MKHSERDSSRPLPSSLLLGFSGPAGSGKDTCAAVLSRYGFRSIAFADALRAEVAEAWRIDARMLTDRVTKEWDIPALAIANCASSAFVLRMRELGEDTLVARSPRWVMQRWGTEYRRHVHGHGYWTNAVRRWVGRQRGVRAQRLCITDVRFDDELAVLEDMGGHQVVVHRPEITTALARNTQQHCSEHVAVRATSPVVHNDGDMEHLHAELMRVVGELSESSRALAPATSPEQAT